MMNDLIAKIFNDLSTSFVYSEYSNISNYIDFLTYDNADYTEMKEIIFKTLARQIGYAYTIKEREYSDRYSLLLVSGLFTIEIEYLIPIDLL